MAGSSAVQIPLIKRKDITLEEVPIGRGGFGTVYRGKHKLFGWVAVKTLIDNGLLPQKHTKALQAEAMKLLEICNHPNILNIYGLIMEKDNYSLILEYMPLGSLTEFRKEFSVRWPLMVQILKDVISGMDFLHKMEPPVFHLDLKADNVLLDGKIHAKLCDFGLSEWKTVTVNVNRNMDKSGRRCTTSHLPPEVWANVSRAPDSYYDIYSFGIVVWELLSGAIPYGSQSDDVIRSAVLSGQRPDFTLFPKDTPPKLSGMMTRCWHQKPAQRPAFSTLKTEIEQLFKEEYERQVIKSLKQLRQEIVQNYEADDPLWTSTVYIETLQEAVEVPEPEPEPEPSVSSDQPQQSQSSASTAPKRPTEPMDQDDENAPVEVKLFKLDKDLEPSERMIRKILKDPVAMRLVKTKYIKELFNINDATLKILNDPKKLARVIDSDLALKWELYYSKNDIVSNLSGMHLEMVNHRAKTYLEVNKDDIEKSFYSSSYSSYSYSYGSRSNEKSEREKRRERVEKCIRGHPHIRELESGGNYYRLKKALENPQHLVQALKEKEGGGSSLSSLKLSTLDPEVIEIAKDPLLLLTILKDKDDIMRNLFEHYPQLLCDLVANARRRYPLPSGGYIDPPRSRMRDMLPPSIEREMMMGMIDPEEIMMMRDMEMRHRMRRHPGDSDSDDDDYPGMMGMHRRMRMMRDMRPSKMESMMRSANRSSKEMESSSSKSEKESKSKGLMGFLKKTLMGKSEKKKDDNEDDFKKPDVKPNVTSVSRSPSTSSSSSSSSAANVAAANASGANVPSAGSQVKSTPAASTTTKTEASKTTSSTGTTSTTAAASTVSKTPTTSTSSASATGSATSSAKSTTSVTPSTTITTSAKSTPSATVTTSASSTTASVTAGPNIKAPSATAGPATKAPPATSSAVKSSAAVQKSVVQTKDASITLPKTVDIPDVEMTIPKLIDDDIETDTIPSMVEEAMEVDLSINRARQQATAATPSSRPSQGSQPSATGSQQQPQGKQQVRSRPISDNSSPPPSGPKKAKITIEQDAVPGASAVRAAASMEPNSFTIGSKEGLVHSVEHHHGDGATTHMKWNEMSKPNVQIGSRNLMVISDDLDDPWCMDPMPQRRRRDRKKKELELTKSTRIVNQTEMDDIAQSLGRDWKKIKRYLNIPEAVIEQVELDYQREGQPEVIYQMLRKWKEMRGSMATIATLAEALHKVGRNDLAEALK